MIGQTRGAAAKRWLTTAFLAAALTLLVATIAGAADRVVLGEYFTNLF